MTGFREKRKQERQQRIFQAAIELVNEKGFQAMKMTEVSERAELAVGTLYNYYPSKNDLLIAVMEEEWGNIMKRHRKRLFKTALTGSNPLNVLQEIIYPVLEDMFIIPKESWGDVIMAMFASPHYMARGYQMDMEIVEGFARLLEKLQQRGLLRYDVDARQSSFSVYSVISFQFLAYIFTPEIQRQHFLNSLDAQLQIIVEGIGSPSGGDESQGKSDGREEKPAQAEPPFRAHMTNKETPRRNTQ